jgi:hypothetical protein
VQATGKAMIPNIEPIALRIALLALLVAILALGAFAGLLMRAMRQRHACGAHTPPRRYEGARPRRRILARDHSRPVAIATAAAAIPPTTPREHAWTSSSSC